MRAVIDSAHIDQLSEPQLRALTQQLLATVSTQQVQLRHKQAAIDKLKSNGETLAALLKRLDRAIARYYDTGETTDEINPPSG